MMQMSQITIKNTNGLPLVDYRTVKPLQGELKDLSERNYNKLKNALVTRGFYIPLFVWPGKDGYYLLDGHQRLRVMTKEKMNDNGVYDVPVVIVDAKDQQEAQARLLEITSQYGTITQEGLDEFLQTAKLPELETLDRVNFDALQIATNPKPSAPRDPNKAYVLGKHRITCDTKLGDGTSCPTCDLLRKTFWKEISGGVSGWEEGTPLISGD